MNKVYFALGIHNHQPVGNFENVLEEGYDKAYKPFLELMSRHPKIKFSLHTSGILWDFYMRKHPEYIDSINEMVKNGRVELLTGGYYEPIIPVIPDADKAGQIKMMSNFLRNKFNFEPKGMWLAERVWEPHLVKSLAEAGVDYIVVDDAHFEASGQDIEQLKSYFVSEEQGVKLNIFPISQRLRYYIPFQPVERTMEYFRSFLNKGSNPLLVMADDGEKFGMWPETYKHVYSDGWLDNFLTVLEQNSDWLETTTFSEYKNKYQAQGRIYLPTASYFEMSEWSLPRDSQESFEHIVKQFEHQPQVKRFLKGGFWRNFLTKYSESNNMHKKMLYVSNKIKANARQIKNNIEDSYNHLYQGQCNCAYWHGVFGGLYLPHLRNAIYEHLIKAEKFVNELIKKPKWKCLDIDCDGNDEYVFESKDLNLYVSPERGGSIFEWDIISKGINLSNVLTRRSESYHTRLREFVSKNHGAHGSHEAKSIHDMVKVKEANLDKYLNYDWYNRAGLLDHFLHPDTTFDGFKFSQYGEQGNFVLGEYQCKTAQESLTLKRTGTIWMNNIGNNIEIMKKISCFGKTVKLSYAIKNLEKREIPVSFAPEFSFAFSCKNNNEESKYTDVSEWIREDNGFGLKLKAKFSDKCDLWTFPLDTVSLSEGGFEKTYQGTVVLPIFKTVIKPESKFETEINFEVE